MDARGGRPGAVALCDRFAHFKGPTVKRATLSGPLVLHCLSEKSGIMGARPDVRARAIWGAGWPFCAPDFKRLARAGRRPAASAAARRPTW